MYTETLPKSNAEPKTCTNWILFGFRSQILANTIGIYHIILITPAHTQSRASSIT